MRTLHTVMVKVNVARQSMKNETNKAVIQMKQSLILRSLHLKICAHLFPFSPVLRKPDEYGCPIL